RSSAIGSMTAPERIWAPTSEPFSTTTTPMSGDSCLSLIAAASPAGPAPTITTSNSIDSRAGKSSVLIGLLGFGPNAGARIPPFRGAQRSTAAAARRQTRRARSWRQPPPSNQLVHRAVLLPPKIGSLRIMLPFNRRPSSGIVAVAMTPDRDEAARALLAFY